MTRTAAAVPGNSSLELPHPAAAPRGPSDATFHLVLLLISAGILLAAFVLKTDGLAVYLPLLNQPLPEACVLRRLTGLSCPGCGLTRCFISLAHGEISSAWSYNPAGLWLFAVIASQIPLRSYQLWRIYRGRSELVLHNLGAIALALFAVILVVQWVLRLATAYF